MVLKTILAHGEGDGRSGQLLMGGTGALGLGRERPLRGPGPAPKPRGGPRGSRPRSSAPGGPVEVPASLPSPGGVPVPVPAPRPSPRPGLTSRPGAGSSPQTSSVWALPAGTRNASTSAMPGALPAARGPAPGPPRSPPPPRPCPPRPGARARRVRACVCVRVGMVRGKSAPKSAPRPPRQADRHSSAVAGLFSSGQSDFRDGGRGRPAARGRDGGRPSRPQMVQLLSPKRRHFITFR